MAAQARAGAQRRLHVPAAGSAGGAGDARRRWQRGRRGAGRRDHPDLGRAGVQRHRLRRLRDRVGRRAVAWVECLGAFAGGVDAGVLRGQPGSCARLEFGDRARCGIGLDRIARPVRQVAVCTDLRAGDPLRPRWVPRLPDGGRAVGEAGIGAAVTTRLRRGVSSWRTGAVTGGAVPASRACRDAGVDRRHSRGVVLPGRAGGEDGGAFDRERRGDAGLRPGRAPRGLGRPDQHRLPGLHAARDPPERSGDRRVDRARHPAALRHGLAPSGFGRQRAPADRGGQVGLRRCAGLRRRHRPHAGGDRTAAGRRLPQAAVDVDRSSPGHTGYGGQAAWGRHGVSDRGRRRRHDGVDDSVELRRVRVRRGRAGHRDLVAEPRNRFQRDAGAPEPDWPAKAPVPHHRSRLPHQRTVHR